jgi:serine/threonine protein kinase
VQPIVDTSTSAVPQVPDFELIRCIGEGGFGQVWLALNRTTGQPRAVKIISRARVGNRDPAGREIASLVRMEANHRCRHRNLLTIYHVGETAEHLFYVMDLADDLSGQVESIVPADGQTSSAKPQAAWMIDRSVFASYRPATLENHLADGPIDESDCERYARQLLAALACLHEAGMVHRDVKPANCLLLGGELKLGDFGLLTAASAAVSRMGTLRYMPPDGCMDSRADVFAAGLVIYEMLTGLPAERFPGLGDRAAEIVKQPRLARLNQIALTACDPDPRRRFTDARQMLAALDGCDKRVGRLRRMKWAVLAAGIVLFGSVVGLWLLPRGPVGTNFVTEPFEATIYLDGELLRDGDDVPYRTPCTVVGLPPGEHRVVFQWDAQSGVARLPGIDGKLDLGPVDLSANRQIRAWPKAE